LAARGIKPQDVIDGIQLVDYSGFVDLVTQHDRTAAWL
jgi:tRNA 2-thiouridine synthesizing protein B